MIAPLGLGALALVVGCANENSSAPVARVNTTETTAVPASSAQDPGGALPDTVSAAFHRDFSRAVVTGVTPSTTEAGQAIYRVTYVTEGTPGSVVYFLDGSRLSGPAGSTPTPPPPTTPIPPSEVPGVGQP